MILTYKHVYGEHSCNHLYSHKTAAVFMSVNLWAFEKKRKEKKRKEKKRNASYTKCSFIRSRQIYTWPPGEFSFGLHMGKYLTLELLKTISIRHRQVTLIQSNTTVLITSSLRLWCFFQMILERLWFILYHTYFEGCRCLLCPHWYKWEWQDNTS